MDIGVFPLSKLKPLITSWEGRERQRQEGDGWRQTGKDLRMPILKINKENPSSTETEKNTHSSARFMILVENRNVQILQKVLVTNTKIWMQINSEVRPTWGQCVNSWTTNTTKDSRSGTCGNLCFTFK